MVYPWAVAYIGKLAPKVIPEHALGAPGSKNVGAVGMTIRSVRSVSRGAMAVMGTTAALLAAVGATTGGCEGKTATLGEHDAGGGTGSSSGSGSGSTTGAASGAMGTMTGSTTGAASGASGTQSGATGTQSGPPDGGDAASTSSTGTGALRFDGLSAQVDVPLGIGAVSQTAFSSELWFKTTAPTGVVFEVYSDNPAGADRSTYLKNGQVCFYVYTPAFSEICTTGALLNDGAWHSVACTLGPSGQLLYVDGTLSAMQRAVTTSAFAGDTGVRLGYGYLGPQGPLTFFAGFISEVRLWLVERTATQLAASRDQSLDPATPGLEGYWKLNESASDSTAGGDNGELVGFSFNPSPWVVPGPF
jgi:hypothetical protein